MAEAAVRITDLVVRYPGREHAAVDHASWSAAAGEVTVLLGPNGAGKTSTVECCVGLRTHTSGEIAVLDRTGPELASARHRAEVGVMLQDGGLPTGAKPVALLRHLARFQRNPADPVALADRLGITDFARTSVRRLSGGQRQRLALACALIVEPRVMFLDEPTAGLDTQARVVVREVLAEHCASGAAVVLTTHDLDEAARVAQRAVVIVDGRVVADGSPAALTRGLDRTLRVGLPPGTDTSGLAEAIPGLVLTPTPGGLLASGADVGPAHLAAVGRWCADRGLSDVELHLGHPSLEDVVLALARPR